MFRIILSIIFATTLMHATDSQAKIGCQLSQSGRPVVGFTAYKTLDKVGVNGVFDRIRYVPIAPKGKNFRSIFVGSRIVIDTQTVNSKNKKRDGLIAKFFFGKMSQEYIEAKIVDIKANKRVGKKPRTGVLSVDIQMNGIHKIVPMNYIFDAGYFKAEGAIDILDFAAGESLASINKACFVPHKGKTWSEVNIRFETKIDFKLCNVK